MAAPAQSERTPSDPSHRANACCALSAARAEALSAASSTAFRTPSLSTLGFVLTKGPQQGLTKALFEQGPPKKGEPGDEPPAKRKKSKADKKEVSCGIPACKVRKQSHVSSDCQVSIVGKVTAVSPLKWTNDRPQFLLQLSLTYNRKSVVVRHTHPYCRSLHFLIL
jgi:hypothetical protein